MKSRKYPTRESKGKISKGYRAWKAMKARCYAPCNINDGSYQKLGIKVCDRWINSFDNFMDDMGKAPSSKHSLDRIENDKEYSPSNCRWALQDVQCKNRGSFNRNFSYNGEVKVLKDWAKYFDVKYTTLRHRILVQGMSFEEALKFKI